MVGETAAMQASGFCRCRIPSSRSVLGSKASILPGKLLDESDAQSPRRVRLYTNLVFDCVGTESTFDIKRTLLLGAGVATAIQGAAIFVCILAVTYSSGDKHCL